MREMEHFIDRSIQLRRRWPFASHLNFIFIYFSPERNTVLSLHQAKIDEDKSRNLKNQENENETKHRCLI